MYGPKGFIWNELDENGNPILLKSEAEMSAEECGDSGMWFWTLAPHSDKAAPPTRADRVHVLTSANVIVRICYLLIFYFDIK